MDYPRLNSILTFGFVVIIILLSVKIISYFDSQSINYAVQNHYTFITKNACPSELVTNEYDIIQLDTGNPIEYKGKHNLNKTKEQPSHQHGKWMAEALISSLKNNVKESSNNFAVYSGYGTPNYLETYFFKLRCILKARVKVISLSAGGKNPIEFEEELI